MDEWEFDQELKGKLEKFLNEAKVKPSKILDVELFPEIGVVAHREIIHAKFRDLYLDGLVFTYKKKGKKLLLCTMNLTGSVGMIACMILATSVALGKPEIIYLHKHVPTGDVSIVAEWDTIKIDAYEKAEIRNIANELLGFKIEKIIKFEDVLKEAKRFLDEYYK
jgi:predicted SPOUT superfamily RNA methylase MTH1